MHVVSQTPPTRCEICHQADCFDPATNFCSRCASIPASVLRGARSFPVSAKEIRRRCRTALRFGRELLLPLAAWALFPMWPSTILWALVVVRMAWLSAKGISRLARRSRLVFGLSLAALSCGMLLTVVGFHHLLNFQLLEATRRGDVLSVKVALWCGADINAGHYYGIVPWLQLRHARPDEDWGLWIEPNDATAMQQVYGGRTSLMIAVETGDARLIGLFIEKHANLEAKDFYGRTALMKAIGRNRPDLATMLLNNGADVNAQSPQGKTALMIAAMQGNQELVNFLLRYGANPSLRDNEGKDYQLLSRASVGMNPSGNHR
ncbi:MAG: ankyrin repeat domain-containing protein [Blastocatellia bacterium]|nr:ankyrin repeat domain-containing protein [Blastocatellia bacterium]